MRKMVQDIFDFLNEESKHNDKPTLFLAFCLLFSFFRFWFVFWTFYVFPTSTTAIIFFILYIFQFFLDFLKFTLAVNQKYEDFQEVMKGVMLTNILASFIFAVCINFVVFVAVIGTFSLHIFCVDLIFFFIVYANYLFNPLDGEEEQNIV